VRIPNGLRIVYGLWVGATLCIRRLNACRTLLQPTFRRSRRAVSALRVTFVSGFRPLARSPNHLGGAGFELMPASIVEDARAPIRISSGETGGRAREKMSGATEELGLARGKPPLAETEREQRAPRGASAGQEGKALKAEILRADVARNKATRPRRAQTAERVRNSVSGWCR
jgi:hypothetical protein